MRGRTIAAILVGTLSISGAIGSSAGASSVRVGPSELELGGPPVIFSAGDGETNRLTVSSIKGDADAVVFRDLGASIAAGSGCAGQPDGSVTCRVNEIAGVRVRLGDRGDQLDAASLRDQNRPASASGTTFFAFEASGGDGDDDLLGADASFACLYGGDGEDRITSAVSRSVPKRAICASAGGKGNDRLIGNRSANVFAGGSGDDSITGRGGRDNFAGGDGSDRIVTGAGNDAGSGGRGDDRVLAGPGRDILSGSPGADVLLGEAGNDRFSIDHRDAAGSDQLRGGAGRDTARFSCPSCRVSLNRRADDGERGGSTFDNVLQVENLVTTSSRFDIEIDLFVDFGPGNDTLTGDRFANSLKGNRGPDRIDGGAGRDDLSGGPGADLIDAADGERDRVSCGPGSDIAIVDPGLDSRRGCESVRGHGILKR